MRFSAKAEYEFIPKASGNGDLPPEEQVRVVISRPKAEERLSLLHLDIEREVDNGEVLEKKTGSRNMTMKRRLDRSRILRNHVKAIKNLEEAKPDGSVVKITGGAALAESTAFGIGALVEEICNEVVSDVLTEDEKKSSA
jgi:hypothetical protein